MVNYGHEHDRYSEIGRPTEGSLPHGLSVCPRDEHQLHLIMQTPNTTQLRTAIEVLKMLGERVNETAASAITQMLDMRLNDESAGRTQVQAIEQTTRIQTVSAQLEQWRGELLQQRRQCVTHHI